MGPLTPDARSNPSHAPLIAALLGPRTPSWNANWNGDEMLDACRAADASALLYHVAGRQPAFATWPEYVREALAGDARAAAVTELLVREELLRVLSAFAFAGLAPILLKGAPLAYTIYDAPSQRARLDTDLLLLKGQVEAALAILTARGYGAPPYSAGTELFGQVPLVRRDAMGLDHWLDVHWEISAARVFADALAYEELSASAVPVPALGPHARTPGPVHTLLLACMHPVMHHRNAVCLAWIYDIHLLAARMDDAAWRAFAVMAKEKRLRRVCAHGLNLAREWLGTAIPAYVMEALTANDGVPEPTAEYLGPGRGWLDELGSDLAARASWGKRLRLLREIALPAPEYMLESYGLTRGPAGWAALPLLYAHRGLRGAWRVARGKK